MSRPMAALVRGAVATLAFGAGAVLVPGLMNATMHRDAVAAIVVLSTIAGVVLAALMDRAAPSGPERAVRVALQTSSLFITIGLVLPKVASSPLPPRLADRLGVPGDVLAAMLPWRDLQIGLGACALIGGAVVVAVAMRDLLEAGGTADPLDPPIGYCRTGLYAHHRHPMQLGQIAVVGGAALLEGTVGAVVGLVLFTITLVGPVRVLEEAALKARFG